MILISKWQVASELLNHAKLKVSIAENGEQAIRQIKQGGIDIVLMDLQMPVMGGIEATQYIRKMERYQDLPIIGLTANTMVNDKKNCIKAGMNDHISKPFSPTELYTVLLKYLKRTKTIIDNSVAENEKNSENHLSIAASETSLTVAKKTEQDLEQVDDYKQLLTQAGFEVDIALARVLENQSLYIRILSSFIQSKQNDLIDIKKHLEAGEFKKAKLIAHSLKGVAGTMGAVKLQQVAKDVEQAISLDEQVDTALLEQFKHVLSESIEVVERAIDCYHHNEGMA